MKQIAAEAYIALNRLSEKGYEAYIVGGALRDVLLNRPISDYDITTSADPKAIEMIFNDYRTYNIGQKHGSIAVLIGDYKIEITPFRKESEYLDHRHPNSIEFVQRLEDDLSRRDLTINALCLDKDDKIVDLFNGINDLSSKTIRAIGDPDKRFKEDALRILRTIRFSRQLDFTIEENTKQALFRQKHLLSYISEERKREELLKLLKCGKVYQTIREYKEIFNLFLPINNLNKDIDKLSDPYFILAYLLRDNDYDLMDLKFSRSESELVNIIRKSIDADITSDYVFIKTLADDHYQKALLSFFEQYHQIDLSDRFNSLKQYMVTSSTLAITGNQLMELGYKGKQISLVKNEIIDLIHRQELNNDLSSIKKHLLKVLY